MVPGRELFFGGWIGWLIVDPISGGMWKLSPKEISPSLKQEISFLGNEDGLMVILKEALPEGVFEALALERIN
jgi:hypothetical protein